MNAIQKSIEKRAVLRKERRNNLNKIKRNEFKFKDVNSNDLSKDRMEYYLEKSIEYNNYLYSNKE